MKQYNKLFAILFAVLGVSTVAKADTSILRTSEGWNKITEIPSDVENYYFALVDNSQDLMMTMAVGANQGNSYYTMYYKTPQNPLQNKAALWTIEGTNYTFRNAEYTKFAMQTEWGAAWYYRTHDQANPCEWTATIPVYSLSEACWTIQNGKYPNSGYLGPWNNTVENGAEVACNKAGDAIGKFQIYAIKKKYCVETLAANATPTNPVDMTVLLANVNADLPIVGLGGWTTANTIARNGNNGYDGKGGFFEFCNWGSTTGWKGSMSQSLSDIPNGKYIVKAAAQASADVVLTLTANSVSKNLACKGDKNGSLGYQGWEYIQVECMVTNGTLDISVNSSATTNAKWGNVDNFTLTYLGPDKSASENIFNDRYAAICNLDTDQPMSSAFKTEISNLINKYKSTSSTSLTQDKLDAANNEMLDLINRYQPNVDAYIKLKKYIDMTEVFTDVTAYRTKYNNEVYTLNDVEPTRQELNVMRFNAASAIFTNKVEVTGWTGSMGERSDQHWSGTTVSYKDANSWGDTNDDALTTTIHLVKGNYVLKVAGRSHVNALLTLEVLGKTIEFHAKGDTGYGIDVNGNATFSAAATYTNGGAGRGWEWEFLKFTVETEQDVTLSVNSHYNNNREVWNSFGDISLWMDDETYVTVNGDAINGPLAEAKKMLNTLPMGDAENTALQEAISLCDTKATDPESLNAQINALNTAVTNAKNWRNIYYTEKGRLVDALERFEADYNDAEKGTWHHLCKSRWATVITEAGDAAVAKDNQKAHTGITQAANDLIAALEAADKSIQEYKDLKAAIDNAAFAAANIGDEAFQRPTSAAAEVPAKKQTAQTTYDAATADGGDVTSVTEELKGANDKFFATPLNAPEEGARYNLVLNNNGNWAHDGKAATYLAGQREDAGLYNIKYYTSANKNYAQAFTFTAVEDQQDCYKLSMTDVDGNERYISTGVPYGGNTAQIRTTTNANEALIVKVIATATDGVHNLLNTEANNYIGSQDEGFFTVNSHINFNLVEAQKAEVTLNISNAKWATLILPFDADIPDGVTAYTSDQINPESNDVTLAEATELKANTPYLINGKEGKYDFSGYGLADKDNYTDAASLFVGTYVDYQTIANAGNYALQNQNGEVAFYLVTNNATPWIRAYHCYLKCTEAAGAPVFRFTRGGATEIESLETTDNNGQTIVIYDLMGRKVNAMEKGKVYIVNGKKVIVK